MLSSQSSSAGRIKSSLLSSGRQGLPPCPRAMLTLLSLQNLGCRDLVHLHIPKRGTLIHYVDDSTLTRSGEQEMESTYGCTNGWPGKIHTKDTSQKFRDTAHCWGFILRSLGLWGMLRTSSLTKNKLLLSISTAKEKVASLDSGGSTFHTLIITVFWPTYQKQGGCQFREQPRRWTRLVSRSRLWNIGDQWIWGCRPILDR